MNNYKSLFSFIIFILSLFSLVSCQSRYPYQGPPPFIGPPLPKPNAIIVYNFAVSPEAITLSLTPPIQIKTSPGEYNVTPQEKILADSESDHLAVELVKQLQNIGLPAIRGSTPAIPPGNVLVITGEFVDFDESNIFNQLIIGVGARSSRIDLQAQVYYHFADPNLPPLLVTSFYLCGPSIGKPTMACFLGVPLDASFTADPEIVKSSSCCLGTALRESVSKDAKMLTTKIMTQMRRIFYCEHWL